MVVKEYNKKEGIDCDETFAHIARLKAIRMLSTYAYARNFKLFQINVKSVFLNGYIMKKVYVQQLPGFKDNLYPYHVFNF